MTDSLEIFEKVLTNKKIPLIMEFVASAMHHADLPEVHVPEIAIVGRSNVGKSSLLNFLSGQKQLARVSNTPGRTQTINLFSAEKGLFYFGDLPGYGFAESPRETKKHWEKSLQNYFEERDTLVGVLFLLDIRREINEVDISLAHWFLKLGLNVVFVQTKIDKLNKSQWPLMRAELAKKMGVNVDKVISTSTIKKIGLPDMCNGIWKLISGSHV